MKVFRFNPKTGKRGELIESKKRISWTSCNIEYAMKSNGLPTIEFKIPPTNSTQEWIAHIDAGDTCVTKEGLKDISYLADEWICFCSGEWNGQWMWVVLPPKHLVEGADK